MAAGARRSDMGTFMTNRKLPPIHSLSVPKNRSTAWELSYGEKANPPDMAYDSCQQCAINDLKSFPNNKILDWSKFKAFADNKIKVTKKLKFASGRVENIVGKWENVDYQHFLLFP